MKIMSSLRHRNLLIALIISMFIWGCGQEKTTTQEETKGGSEVSSGYMPLGPILEMQPSVTDSLQDWKSYWDLQQEMENFRMKKSGDLGYVTDELIRIQGELINDSIPEKANNPAVKSRSLVFRTFALKLKDQIEHGAPAAEIDSTRVKLLETYNAFRFHISDALRVKAYEDFLKQDSTFTDSSAIR